MRRFPMLACVSLAALLSACAQSDGYYDADGRYVYTTASGAANSEPPFEHDVTLRDHVRNDSRMRAYERRGYYDFNGNYMNQDDEDLNVPTSMFPPRGMCRVWFTDRDPSNQPPVKSCNRIRSRVPAGAYVIYGG